MKVAVAADLHLRLSLPDSYDYLNVLLESLRHQGITSLLIAGDLFDSRDDGHGHFNTIAAQYPDIQIHVIPGNHDRWLDSRYSSNVNVQIIEEITVLRIDGVPFLLLPYGTTSMGEEVLAYSGFSTIADEPWVLVSHGDFGTMSTQANGNEKGYFPLTREMFTRMAPRRTLLGHIHIPRDYADEGIYYTGSLRPVSADERGPRSFLVLDTTDFGIDRQYISVPWKERINLQVYPSIDEQDLEARIAALLPEKVRGIERSLCDLDIVVRGYHADPTALETTISTFLNSLNLKSVHSQFEVMPRENRGEDEFIRDVLASIDKLDVPDSARPEIRGEALAWIFAGGQK